MGISSNALDKPFFPCNGKVQFRGCDRQGIFEGVLGTVVEADTKGAKRLAFQKSLNRCDFHGGKVTSGAV